VSSSLRSVPGPVRTVCHTSICVGRPYTARSHQRSARRRKSSGGHISLSLLMLGGLVTGLLSLVGRLRSGGRVVGRRWAGGNALTARRGWQGGGKAVAWWRAGGWLAVGWR